MLNQNEEPMKENENEDEKRFDIIGVLGLGSSIGSTYGEWNLRWSKGPSLAFGIEIPLTISQNISFELYNYLNISKLNIEMLPYSVKMEDAWEISNNYYCKMLSFVGFKFTLFDLMEDNRLKINCNVDIPFFPRRLTEKIFNYYNLGLGVNYRYTSKSSLSLSYRMMLELLPLLDTEPDDSNPNLLVLNYSYNF
jgi:hypothetical protein